MLLKKLIKGFITVFGDIDIVIKPHRELKPELLQRIVETDKGAELFTFSLDEFKQITQKLLNGEAIDKNNLRKVRKDGKGNIVQV